MPTPAQIETMRKVAFHIGVARYLHLHGAEDPRLVDVLSKTAGADDAIKLALLGVPVLGYLGGRHLGRVAGNLYGSAQSPSKSSVGEREYRLAAAATQRMIDDVNADRTNAAVSSVIDDEENKNKPAARPFATPSLLRYGR
jgi:hypothetical protein